MKQKVSFPDMNFPLLNVFNMLKAVVIVQVVTMQHFTEKVMLNKINISDIFQI